MALLLAFSLFSVASFAMILMGANPYSAGSLIRVLFFITLFFSLTGLLAIVGTWISRFSGRALGFEVVFRRSVLLATLILSLVLLETFSILNFVNSLAVFVFVVAIEMLAVYRR